MSRGSVKIESGTNLFDKHLFPSNQSYDKREKPVKLKTSVNLRPSLVSLQISSVNDNLVIQLEEKEYDNEAELEKELQMKELDRQRTSRSRRSSYNAEPNYCRNCQCYKYRGSIYEDIMQNRNLYRNTFGPTVDETLLVGYETLCCLCRRHTKARQDEDRRSAQSVHDHVEQQEETEPQDEEEIMKSSANWNSSYSSDVEIRNEVSEAQMDDDELGNKFSSNTPPIETENDAPVKQEEVPEPKSSPSVIPRRLPSPRFPQTPGTPVSRGSPSFHYSPPILKIDGCDECNLSARRPIPDWQQKQRFPTVEFKRSDQSISPSETPSSSSSSDSGGRQVSYMMSKQRRNLCNFIPSCQVHKCCHDNSPSSRWGAMNKPGTSKQMACDVNNKICMEGNADGSCLNKTGKESEGTLHNSCGVQTPSYDSYGIDDQSLDFTIPTDEKPPVAESTRTCPKSPAPMPEEDGEKSSQSLSSKIDFCGLPTIKEEPEEDDETPEKDTSESTTSGVTLPGITTPVPTPPSDDSSDATDMSENVSAGTTTESSSAGVVQKDGIKSISNSEDSSVKSDTTLEQTPPDVQPKSELSSYSKPESIRKTSRAKENGYWEKERELWEKKLKECEENCEAYTKRLEEDYTKLSKELAKEQEERQMEREAIKKEFEQQLQREREYRESQLISQLKEETFYKKLPSERDSPLRNPQVENESKLRRTMELDKERNKLLEEERILEEERKKRIQIEQEMELERLRVKERGRQMEEQSRSIYEKSLREQKPNRQCKCHNKRNNQKSIIEKRRRPPSPDKRQEKFKESPRELKPARELQNTHLKKVDPGEDRFQNLDLRNRNREPQDTKYAVTRITKYGDFKTYEILKTTKSKPKSVPCAPEEVFIVKNKNGLK